MVCCFVHPYPDSSARMSARRETDKKSFPFFSGVSFTRLQNEAGT